LLLWGFPLLLLLLSGLDSDSVLSSFEGRESGLCLVGFDLSGDDGDVGDEGEGLGADSSGDVGFTGGRTGARVGGTVGATTEGETVGGLTGALVGGTTGGIVGGAVGSPIANGQTSEGGAVVDV
jgi:hypothetical protein